MFTVRAMGVYKTGELFILGVNPKVGFIQICLFIVVKRAGNHAIIAA
jgi:hypothetical protein